MVGLHVNMLRIRVFSVGWIRIRFFLDGHIRIQVNAIRVSNPSLINPDITSITLTLISRKKSQHYLVAIRSGTASGFFFSTAGS